MVLETVEAVRVPLAVRAHSRRRLEERLCLRFPSVAAFGGRAILRLPPRSQLRQRVLRRASRLFLEAFNREDFDAAYSLYHPDSETIFPQELATVGLERITRGRQAMFSLQRLWHLEWGEFRVEPEELIDLESRMLILGRFTGIGVRSGAGVKSDWGLLLTLATGRVIREQIFLDHREALEAAGLRK